MDNRFESGGNPIFVQDTGGRVEFLGNFNVRPSITINKSAAQLGDEFDATFHHFTKGILELATIGGENLLTAIVKSGTPNAEPPDNVFRFEIPSGQLDAGVQQVRVRVGQGGTPVVADTTDEIATVDLSVGGLPLTFSPAIAVPGQQITIKGRGFSRGATIATIEIGDANNADELAYDVREKTSLVSGVAGGTGPHYSCVRLQLQRPCLARQDQQERGNGHQGQQFR